jgi:hypothetical protein
MSVQTIPATGMIGVARLGGWLSIGGNNEIVGTPIMMRRARACRTFRVVTINGKTVAADQQVFDVLRQQWHRERGATSSITTMAMCPAYQSIIAKGPKIIPRILRQLELEGDEPDMWFWALRVLTNENPVPLDAQGDVVRMAQAWLTWGRAHYAW